METLLLNKSTRSAINGIFSRSARVVLLVGLDGSGKSTIARTIAAQSLQVTEANLSFHPYLSEIYPDGSSVTIEQVRGIQQFLSLKTTGNGEIRRVVIIHHSDAMTREAQNAFLKSLEEPPLDTQIILTVSQVEDLLQTIRSRVQTLHISSPHVLEAVSYFTKRGHTEAAIQRAYAISGGAVGLMQAMLSGDTTHSTSSEIERAKELLRQSVYERLCSVDTFSKQKDDTRRVLFALKRVCVSGLYVAAEGDKTEAVSNWLSRVQRILSAEEAFHRNANAKLALTDLFMSL